MNQNKRHYFDWAAAGLPIETPVDGNCRADVFGNPSSPHLEGRRAREALEDARLRSARILGVAPETLYFTSGGTESNTLVLFSLLQRQGKGRLLFSAAEHPSIRENCFVLERLGLPVGTVPVEKDGRVSAETLTRVLEKNIDTRFAALMAVNNETGAISDIKALAAALGEARRVRQGAPIHLHCDLVQAVGKIPLDLAGWNIDSASISAHKLGGPRGIGLLYLRKPLEPLIAGKQERGLRPGTENTAGALGLADALEKRAAPENLAREIKAATARFAFLISELKKMKRCGLIPDTRTQNDPRFSPWILQARFAGIPGEVMARALDSLGIAVSTGSACTTASPDRPVLRAMGVDQEGQREGIRISQGWSTTEADINALLAGIEKALETL